MVRTWGQLAGLALAGALLAPPRAHAQPTAHAPPSAIPDPAGLKLVDAARAGKPLWATLKTSQGTLVVELAPTAAPRSVAALVGYASGALAWKDPKTQLATTRPLYDGTLFHRVIPGFVVQGGDPTGTGTGGPGSTTPDEAELPAQKALHFTRGTVGLAHAPDPKANGSQFFIVVGDAPWLDGRYTQVGHVVGGLEVADAMAQAPRGPGDRPLKPVVLESMRISEKPPVSPRKKK